MALLATLPVSPLKVKPLHLFPRTWSRRHTSAELNIEPQNSVVHTAKARFIMSQLTLCKACSHHVLTNPGQELCDTCVDSGEARLGTPVAERYDAELHPVAALEVDQRAARVALRANSVRSGQVRSRQVTSRQVRPDKSSAHKGQSGHTRGRTNGGIHNRS